MSMSNFLDFMNDLAQDLTGHNKSHLDFINKADLVSNAVQGQLVTNKAAFQNRLGRLHKTGG